MANVAVYNMEGKEVGSLELNDAVFGVEVNEHLVHMAVLQQLANNRQGTQKAKTRSEVRGGGRKPWRQKGTGHARQGSTRAPPRRASEKNAPWAALADCIMPPNLFGHTMSGHKWGPHEVAYFVGKGETNGAIELSHLRGSERYGVCFDARQAAVAGLKAAKAPSMSCESCQALSALLPIAGARAANTA